MRFVNRLFCFVFDLVGSLVPEPELHIDLKRVNIEDCAERRKGLDEDVEYRTKVRRRILEGLEAKDLPPLVNRDEFLRKRRRRKNVLPLRKEEKTA